MFLFGFAKNDQDNIDDDQMLTLKQIAEAWLTASDAQLSRALSDGLLVELMNESEN